MRPIHCHWKTPLRRDDRVLGAQQLVDAIRAGGIAVDAQRLVEDSGRCIVRLSIGADARPAYRLLGRASDRARDRAALELARILTLARRRATRLGRDACRLQHGRAAPRSGCPTAPPEHQGDHNCGQSHHDTDPTLRVKTPFALRADNTIADEARKLVIGTRERSSRSCRGTARARASFPVAHPSASTPVRHCRRSRRGHRCSSRRHQLRCRCSQRVLSGG